MVKSSLAPLIKKLEREFLARQKSQDEHRQLIRKFSQSLNPPYKPTPSDLAANKALNEKLLKKMKTRKVDPPQAMYRAPQIHSGSIITINVPPYDAQWSTIQDSENTVSKNDGTWKVHLVCSDGEGWKWDLAGVCTFLYPLPGIFNIHFGAFMHLAWDIGTVTGTPPWDFGDYATAQSRAFVGAYAAAWCAGRWCEMVDNRNNFYSLNLTVNGGIEDVSGMTVAMDADFVTPSDPSPLVYALWAWGGVGGYGDNGFGGGTGRADMRLSANIPFIVIRQDI